VLGSPSRAGVALLLGGVPILFVSVIAQLAVTDGLAETLWVAVSIIGAIVIVAGIAVLLRHASRSRPPED
jgi:hypothetical protein